MSEDDRRETGKLAGKGSSEALSAYEQQRGDAPDIPEIHRSVLREQFEPSEGQQRVPVVLFILFLGLAMWAGWYLSEFDGNFQADVYDGPDAFRSVDLSRVPEGPEPKVDPMLVGRRIFNNCVSCHQSSGEGVAGKYPPLDGTRWVLGDDRILSRILLRGLRGPIEVLGEEYNGEMPAWNQFSDRDIAAVLTYIRSSWGNDAPAVSEATVAAVREELSGRSRKFTAAELRALDLPPREADSASQTKEASDEPQGGESP